MGVCRQLRNIQRVSSLATQLSQNYAVADVKRGAALQVRQAKGLSSVASVGCTQDRKQGLVLVDGQ